MTLQALKWLHIWYNKNMNLRSEKQFLNSWSNKGKTQMKFIVNTQGKYCITYEQLNHKYNINTNF